MDGAGKLTRRGGALIAAVALMLAVLPGAAMAATPGVYDFSGEAGGCDYELELDSGARRISMATTSCQVGGLTATAEAGYEGEGIVLEHITATGVVDGNAVAVDQRPAGAAFTIGSDLESLAAAVDAGAPPSTLGPASEAFARAATDRIAAAAFEGLAGAVFSESRPVRQVEEAEDAYCDRFSGRAAAHTNENCLPTECPGGCEQVTSQSASVGQDAAEPAAEAPAPAGLTRALLMLAPAATEKEKEEKKKKEKEEENEELCPAVNNTQKKVIFACLPTVVHGDIDTGSKPLVLLPGAVLIMLPIGGSSVLDLSTTPTIRSSASVVSLGGVIAGYNTKVKAPTLSLAAGVIDMFHKVTLEGEHVDLGSVDIDGLLGGAPTDVTNSADANTWIDTVKGVAALSLPSGGIFDASLFTAPILIAGAVVDVKPSKDFTLGPTSHISAGGRGGAGGEGANDPGGKPRGEAPGGAEDEFGGSHAGYGGYDAALTLTTEDWGTWQEAQGRGPTYGDPFAPTTAGAGGSGGDDVDRGANGGGVVRIDASQAPVRIEGRVDADGNGLDHRFAFEDTGGAGAGAGGSVYLTAKSLSGAGTISADGGGYCPDCINGNGGMGGGGRVALVYGEAAAWSGTARAHGGLDEQYPGFGDTFFAGTGGAGTVFTRQVKFKGDGSVEAGLGEFTDGVLTIDGGRPTGSYPPPDGTPIGVTWSSPHRKLVLAGEARGYGSVLEFGEVDVLGGSDLTGDLGGHKLKLTAGKLAVDAASRIDMSSRGYAGGRPGYDDSQPEGGVAETAPGQTPAVRAYGGSHGGAGGTPTGYLHPEFGDRPSSTYDDPRNPTLPGGGGAGDWDTADGNPGGGVLDITAGTLRLDGLIAADGGNNNGPTADDPTPFSRTGGAGAGGSVLVHTEALSGSGTVRADGGWACLTGEGPPLMEEGNSCNSGGGASSGAGGGGRVAVYATSCAWTGSLSAAGGISQNAIGTEDAAQATGGEGSVYFQEAEGDCSSGGGAGGGDSGGGDAGGGGQGAGPAGRPAAPDRRAPRLSRLALHGRTLRVAVSEPGTVTIKLARCKVQRSRRHGKLVKRTKCRTAKTITVRAKHPGALRIRLPRGLPAGTYRVTVLARDRAGNRAKPLVRTVKLHPPPRRSRGA
jgi:hypothetical protein